MRVSVVVPAHNEAPLLPRSLEAIARAATRVDGGVEVVVVDNRSTDATAEIAASAGAIVVRSEARSIASVRNAGVVASSGGIVVTVDADSVMAESALADVVTLLESGRYVGGGCSFRPEQTSLGIRATLAVARLSMSLARLSGAMFWCGRADFDAVGGFDEDRLVAEDLDFARRLRAHGRRTGGTDRTWVDRYFFDFND